MTQPCRACGAADTKAFYALKQVPVQSCVLLESKSDALAYPMAQLRLSICGSCAFIQNDLFSTDVQGPIDDYESSQAHSPRFRAYMEELCGKLVEQFGMRDRRVLEVGCGAGDFLHYVCAAGDNEGVGYDPAYAGELNPSERLRFVKKFYDERAFDEPFDCLACRHTLEHIPNVSEFVTMLRRACGGDAARLIVVEVPDMTRILRERAFWDVYYEHCSYFSAGSLGRLCARLGLAIESLELVYDGQYLLLMARPRTTSDEPGVQAPDDRAELLVLADRFSTEVNALRDSWRDRLARQRLDGKRAVVWGAGSKAAGFLTSIEGSESIEHIVDINPRKQGMFQAGSGQEIVAPSALSEIRPDSVIIMNPIYRDEIGAQLRSLGLTPELLTV